jgi:hypothetical protein
MPGKMKSCCDDQDRCWHDVSCTLEKRWSALGEPFGHAERSHLGIGPEGYICGAVHRVQLVVGE